MGTKNENVPYTIITDNAGGYLMSKGEVDLCIVGSDRITRDGDVCNKIGTYLKALASKPIIYLFMLQHQLLLLIYQLIKEKKFLLK